MVTSFAPGLELTRLRAAGAALRRHKWYALALACCVVLAGVSRLPFLSVPLTQDEGGYAYVAQQWAAGAHLYADAWVDRPQGLMLLFRLLVTVTSGTVGVRLFGVVYAALSALALAYVGARLYGAAAGLCSALLYAVFSSSPQIEGFTVNGELLATLPTVAAVALLLRAAGRPRPWPWLFLAGLCAGAALLVKQSSIDAPIVVVLFALLGASGGGRDRLRRVAVVLAGIGVALGLSALHGALTGWQAYLNAVVLDNLRYHDVETATSAASTLGRAVVGLKEFWNGGAFLIVAALIGAAGLPWLRARLGRLPLGWLPLGWLPLPWVVAAAAGVTLGGLYNRHYFVQVLPPLCLLAALALVTVLRVVRSRPPVALLLAVGLAALGVTIRADVPYYLDSSPVDIAQRLYGWPEYVSQQALVSFIQARVPAGQPIYVAYAAPELHYLTGRPSVTPYLWRRPVADLPGAYAAVLQAVDQAVPVCVIAVQAVSRPPGDVRMRLAIGRHYVQAWTGYGLAAYCRH